MRSGVSPTERTAALPPVPAQPDDWTEPGAYLAATGVHRIPLPMPYDGLRAVNLYLIEEPEGLLAIDSGWAIPETTRHLTRALALLGHTPADLTRFVISHAHHDHYTQALALHERYGCEVALGRGERPTIESYGPGCWEPMRDRLLRAGATALAQAFLAHKAQEMADDHSPWGPPTAWLDDGEQIDLGSRTLEVRATPGHTRGHVVFRDVAAGLLFAGDHVLPHITPSIGYEAAAEELPLSSYLASLRLTRDLPDALLLPAHGPVTASAHERVDELLAHHAGRFEAIRDRLERGDSTAFEIASSLPWTRAARRLDDLETMHAAMAVLETKAHLDVLVELGEVDQWLDEDVEHHELPTAPSR